MILIILIQPVSGSLGLCKTQKRCDIHTVWLVASNSLFTCLRNNIKLTKKSIQSIIKSQSSYMYAYLKFYNLCIYFQFVFSNLCESMFL